MQSSVTGGMVLLAQAAEAAAAATDAVNFRPTMWYIAPIASLLALVFAVYFYRKMMSASEGTEVMKEIAQHVREGAMAYLRRQYMVVTMVFVLLVVILTVLAKYGIQNPFVPIAFLTG
ncbi:MAG TPA: sodium/proton-translocating pyrophosphatase, partial [Lacipirellulaceae bacterium]|nr:sodium/proton-translocating pyrophosphatase [Lacipirellulaceae bacterium]